MLGTRECIGGMERVRLGFFKIFEDDRAFENGMCAHLKYRRLAQGGDRQEPVGLVGEIDVNTLEWYQLFR